MTMMVQCEPDARSLLEALRASLKALFMGFIMNCFSPTLFCSCSVGSVVAVSSASFWYNSQTMPVPRVAML
jgi:hypothetical protein